MLICYITDRRQFPGDPGEQRRRLLEKIAEAAAAGVDYVQLREKDLTPRELESLAGEALQAIHRVRLTARPAQPATRLLINSRADVALAVGADGVHLPGNDVPSAEVRALWAKAAAGAPVISVSCHTADEVSMAAAQGADFALFAPVLEKEGRPGIGLAALRAACLQPAAATGVEATPARGFSVLALGGVTAENAADCRRAGAAGIAGIRLFQERSIAQLVSDLLHFP